MAYSARGVTAAANKAKAAGAARFAWLCSEHGEQMFYSGSAACPCCTVERKNKVLQNAYNRRVKDLYPRVKRLDGSWTRKKIQT